MRKLTRGYILLTLLVLTGFAGQVSNQTISSKERTQLVSRLKTAKQSLLTTVEDLTPAQLAFKADKTAFSIAEKVIALNAAQSSLLAHIDANINNETDGAVATSAPGAPTIDADELIGELKTTQAVLVKYAKTTTDDLHAHTVQLPAGKIDAYEALLALPALSEKCLVEIEALKQHPKFPN